MNNIFKGKIVHILSILIKSSPQSVFFSMLFKALFLITQVASIGLIMSWALGHVKPFLVDIVGNDIDSIIYPSIGAFGFVASSVFSFFSKYFALKSTYNLEKKIIDRLVYSDTKLIPGNLKNVVKLMLAIVDNVVPIILLLGVSLVWAYIVPYSIIFVFLLLVAWLWILRRGVGISAKRYAGKRSRISVEEYIESEEHAQFYKILILPNYIFILLLFIISVSLVFTLSIAKSVIIDSSGVSTYLILLTGIAIIQTKSFVGIVLRVGAYNKSLICVDKVLSYDGKK